MSTAAPRAGIETVRDVASLRARVGRWREAGETVALVPTMGALHAGHGALIAAARAAARRVIVSVFVNPTQFGPSEDFAAYPRDESRDAAFLREAGADLLYAPTVVEMYPDGFATTVSVSGLTERLCGPFRPGHFDGVATVVTKLLVQAAPDVALFGEKDYQQLCVIRQLARDLDLPVAIDGVPTVREADGLALSSRNAYLTEAERAVAPTLYRTLRDVAARIAAGGDVGRACTEGRAALEAAGFRKVDYLDCVEADTLAPLREYRGAPARVLAAAHLGRARLIDNVSVQL